MNEYLRDQLKARDEEVSALKRANRELHDKNYELHRQAQAVKEATTTAENPAIHRSIVQRQQQEITELQSRLIASETEKA